MISISYIYNFLFFILIFIIQLYWPAILIKENLYFQLDIILIYITVLSIIYGRFIVIIVAFFGGLLQDATIFGVLGVFSLSKSIVAFCVGSIFNYRTIWSRNTQYIIVFASYLIHFIVSCYLTRGLDYIYIPYILISSLVPFIVLLVVNNLIYKGRLFSN